MLNGFLANNAVPMLLATAAAFAAVAAAFMPGADNERREARMRMVARERGQLREARLVDLSPQTKARLRRETLNLVKHLSAWLKAGNPFAAQELAQRLRMAGLRGLLPETIFLILRAAAPFTFFCLAYAWLMLIAESRVSPATAFLLALGCGAIGFGLPRLVLARLIVRRQTAILRAFPDALDLLLICVQAGMSVEVALAKVAKEIASQSVELAEELSLTMAELAYLPSRWQAYHNLGERTGLLAVRMIAAALAQAERHGTSIGQALAAAAFECRAAAQSRAEQKAAALPPKLAIPLVVFFLPVLLVIIAAPAFIKIGDELRTNGGSLMVRPSPQQGARNSRLEQPTPPSRDLLRRPPQ
jgi:tight adherence protein C